MPRYIDVDALKKRIPETRIAEFENCRFCELLDQKEVMDIIDTEPTADVEEVKHGYWIIKPHGFYLRMGAFCSSCGEHSGIGGIEKNQRRPYCPNCGAKMDGKENEDD